ncbi:MAG: hypothetical protein WBV45_02535 [Lutimonas sp.]
MKFLPHTIEATLKPLRILSLTLLMIFAVAACNDDDNDDMIDFLDKHGDTQWKFQDPNSDTVLYLRVNDSRTNPFELWLTFLANSCYVYQSVEDDGTPEILENTENKLVIRVEESNDEYTIVTLTVSQNVLTVTNEDYENGELDEENIVILFANQDDIGNIEICAF